jgi:hypothetical protein
VIWEGPGAVEECSEEPSTNATRKPTPGGKPKQNQPSPLLPLSESEGDPSSEDEYIAEESKSKGRIGKVCI